MMLPSSRRWIVLTSAALVFASLLTAADAWHRVTWQDEPAWTSDQSGHRAIVSEARERLIYFGAADGEHNLLSAPKKKDPTDKESSPNWGGHRFWLGPQSRWGWPPPKDWEFSAAASAQAKGEVLVLTEAHTNAAYPLVQREYAWEGNRLRCSVRWQGAAQPSYAMHVVAIEVPAEFRVELHSWDHVPQGLVAVNGDTPGVRPLPHSAVTVENGYAAIRTGVAVGKFGFAPQTLSVKREAATLILHPCISSGTTIESPDFGYLTQLWVGNASSTFCELEQLTPFLLPAADGWCGSTMYLEIRDADGASR